MPPSLQKLPPVDTLVPVDLASAMFPYRLLSSAKNVIPSYMNSSQYIGVFIESARTRVRPTKPYSDQCEKVYESELQRLPDSVSQCTIHFRSEHPTVMSLEQLHEKIGLPAHLSIPIVANIVSSTQDSSDNHLPSPSSSSSSSTSATVAKAISSARRVYKDLLPPAKPQIPGEPYMHPSDISAIEAKARLGASAMWTSAVDDSIKGIVDGMKDSIVKSIGGVMSSTLTDTLQSGLGQGVTTTLTDELVEKLVPELTAILSGNIETSLPASLSGSMEEAIPRDLDAAVSPGASAGINEQVNPQVTESVSKSVPNITLDSIPEQTALDSIKPLVHTLARSLPNTIAPALSSTISHAPSQDYMCYACSSEGGNACNNCHYTSVKTFYSSYYANTMSNYYGDFYSNYYFDYYRNMIDTPPGGAPGVEPTQSGDSSQSYPSDVLPSGRGEDAIPPTYPSKTHI
jgi:hypothetical protein